MSERLIASLARARRNGGAIEWPGRLSIDEGYALAEALAPLLGAPAGWKIGATNAGGQAALGTTEPIRGRVFERGIVASGAALVPPGARPCEAEPEILLAAGDDPDQPARAFLGVEINRPSHDDAIAIGAGFIVADNAAHVALVLGPELPLAALDDPASLTVTIERNGEPAGGGDASAVLGNPRHAFAWLAGKVRLAPGELVATGAMCRAVRFAPGDRIVARFGAHGMVEAHWPAPSEVMAGHRL